MNEYEKARKKLVDDLRGYLIGPLHKQDEVISEPAWDRYHVGMLFPAGTNVPPEEDEQERGTDPLPGENGADEGVLALANVARQAACGMTFQVMQDDPVLVDLEYAEYVAEWLVDESETQSEASAAASKSEIAASSEEVGGESTKSTRYVWRRTARKAVGIEVPDFVSQDGNRTVASVIHEEGKIQLVVNQRMLDGIRIITVSVVNRRVAPERGRQRKPSELPADEAIYQVSLQAHGLEATAIFLARPPGVHISDPEFITHELLYRNAKQFAVGHGCAVDWDTVAGDPTRAKSVWLEWIPATQVAKASAVVDSLARPEVLDLYFLSSHGQKEQICEELESLVSTYGKWIDGLESRCPEIVLSFAAGIAERIGIAAGNNLKQCRRVKDRMSEGIALLRSDDDVFEAFCLANQAMSVTMRKSRPADPPKWFPFQIAFLLMALPSALDPDHPDRTVMDLIWFPTGGGKTEAYLGLVSIILFHRRILGCGAPESSGTAVLTRYTLRLLTVQQFERAARTIMACEAIRRTNENRFGKAQFTIGLFVGNGVTPGTLEHARKIIDGSSQPDETATTLPLTKCPWCGSSLSFRNQRVTGKAVVTSCPDAKCDFHKGIPFACVDEQLYESPPSMIIGTVDKFAMMAWEPQIGEFFGSGKAKRQPPSLIIQDELHLISDALGTITALYETAIDYLCSRDGKGPKVVGSTATIRRAPDQAKRLYARTLQQFPPSGLDHDDSFFYGEDKVNPGRLYVGVHAQGRSPKYTLARVMGTLSQGALGIADESARDHYYTLVAYFNSLRELGGAIVLAYDDVQRYIEAMPDAGKERRQLSVIQELTSYLPSQEIPGVLELMGRGISDPDPDSAPIDLVLSTNMISVGVDVDRLGLMVVNGQPKTTSEYIQASSRVGRPKGSAGLVVTLYNWTRPRDRSHYERFRTYHQSFYRYVEATTVTPFSPRARDRALHGVLFALARLSIPQIAGPTVALDAQGIEKLNKLCEVLVSRAEHVEDKEATHTRTDLEHLVATWLSAAEDGTTWRRDRGAARYFLAPPSRVNSQAVFDSTPQSMRDVDPPSPVRLLSASELVTVFGGGN